MSFDTNPPPIETDRREDSLRSRSSLAVRLAVAAGLCIVLGACIAFLYWPSTGISDNAPFLRDGPDTRPAAIASDGYLGSQSCRQCHSQQHTSWHASYHRTMTQVASPEAILGDFEDTQLELNGHHFRLGRDGDDFWIELDDPFADPKDMHPRRIRRTILLCTGSHHMQAYWYSTGRGRELAIVPFIWVNDRQRWIPRRMAFLQPPREPPLPGMLGTIEHEIERWNHGCVGCHATHGKVRNRIRPAQTEVVEFGISCEACHGPGESHVRFHRDGIETGGDPIVHPEKLDHRRSSQICGRCHSSWAVKPEAARDIDENGFSYRPGDDLNVQLNLRHSNEADRFWADGRVRTLGREYHGLIKSPCYQKGEMSCITCHAMHKQPGDERPLKEWADDQLKPEMRSNQACLQCHEAYRSPEQLAAHSHHAADSSGSSCINCHMPNTAYGLLKQSNCHHISSPTVTETLDFGRPTACNLCHLDKPLKWTGRYLTQWYGQPESAMSGSIAEVADSVRLTLRGDAGQRAMMAWHFGWQPAREASGDQWMVPYLAYLMADEYPSVRQVAHASLKKYRGYDDIEYEMTSPGYLLTQARKRIVDRWSSREDRPRDADPALLILPDGKLDADGIDELLRLRDHREVRIIE